MTAPGATIQIRRNTWQQWTVLNPILRQGEQGMETDTGRVRVGDGHTRFVELDFYMPSKQVITMINDALLNAGAGDGGAAQAALAAHIASETPHAAYDDGPSLVLRYRNAKAG